MADPAPTPTAPASAAPKSAASPIAGEGLPKALRATLSEPPPARVDLYITDTAVLLDADPLWTAKPKKRPPSSTPGAGPVTLVKIGRAGVDPAGLAHLQKTLAGAHARAQVEDLQLIAGKDVPYAHVMTVLGAARAAGLKRWWIRARGRSKTGSFAVRRARWCAEAVSAPQPCSIAWTLVTDTRTITQIRTQAEAACGIPPVPAPPKPATLITDTRSRCRSLRHTDGQVAAAILPPHLQRHIKGMRCPFGTVAAWPTVRWTQVTEVADALRAAGHTTIALSLAAPDEICPAPAQPASGQPASIQPASAPSGASK